MDLPAPFSAKPFLEINKTYLKNMKLGSFLEDGEWTGYFSHSAKITNLKFRAPMVGIRFQAKASTVDEPADASDPEDQGFRLKAEGTDCLLGSFTLPCTALSDQQAEYYCNCRMIIAINSM